MKKRGISRALLLGGCFGVAAAAGLVFASSVSLPHTFSAGTPASAAQVNDNFSALKSATDDNDTRISHIESSAPAQRIVAMNTADNSVLGDVIVLPGAPTPSGGIVPAWVVTTKGYLFEYEAATVVSVLYSGANCTGSTYFQLPTASLAYIDYVSPLGFYASGASPLVPTVNVNSYRASSAPATCVNGFSVRNTLVKAAVPNDPLITGYPNGFSVNDYKFVLLR